jgi:tight adherence protein B
VITLAALAATAVLLWPGRRESAAAAWPHRGTHPTPGVAAAGPEGLLALARLAVTGRRAARPRPGIEELAELVELLVPALRSGASTATAVGLAAHALAPAEGLGPLPAELLRAARAGEPQAGVWARAARASGSDEMRFLARAWALSEETGVPLAAVLATVARSLRARQSSLRALAAATAGARASMVLLALLPATGPGIGLLFGLTPLDLYGRSPVAAAFLLAGTVLGLGGLLWSRAILRRAVRPAVVS